MAGTPQLLGFGKFRPLTDGATITIDAGDGQGNAYSVTLGGNRNLDINNPLPGQIIELKVTQDGTGSRLLTPRLNGVASTVLTSGTPLTTTAGAIDRVRIEYDEAAGKLLYYPVAKAFA